ncbi:MAG: hypothetical protein P1V97_31615 [Planctomycetota bacterium]|nr:hypothetical protein [Planctomycetota bacterium]
MDKEFRDFERSANLEPNVQRQAELARPHWRAGRLLEAYDVYQAQSLLEMEHPGAVALAKEMAEIQKPYLEKMPASWKLYRCFPDWAHLAETINIRKSEFDKPIDTISILVMSVEDQRENLAALPFLRGLKLVRDWFPMDWSQFQESKDLENLWLFFQSTPEALDGLEQIQRLKRVNLFCDQVRQENVEALCQVTSMEELTIYQEGRPIEQLKGLAALSNLKQFVLGLNEFNPKRLNQLLDIASLTHLMLPDCELNEDQVNQLKALPKIEVIQWGDNQVCHRPTSSEEIG